MVGDAEYMAPEMINKSGHKASVDWWGLGCVIYGLLTGKMLFSGMRDEVFRAIMIGLAEHLEMAIYRLEPTGCCQPDPLAWCSRAGAVPNAGDGGAED